MYKVLKAETLAAKIHLMVVHAPRVASHCLPGQFIIVKLDDILRDGSWRDPKSHLQEVSQRIDGHTPIYRVLEEDGPDHDKMFTLGVFVGEKQMGQGTGPSKQAAQQAAAKAALEKYQA